MDYSYEYIYGMEDEMVSIFGAVYLIYYLCSIGLGIASYILSSVGLCSIAKRRGIDHPWLAWIPIARSWIVGSISDQYRYVTKGQIKNKRKVLLGLEIGTGVAAILMFVGAVAVGVAAETGGLAGAAVGASVVLALLVGALVILGVSLAYAIFYYMAMYDLYTSVNPPYNVVFLVLSIIFRVTEPFFVFFNRKKDGGMPPRCDIPVTPVAPSAPQPIPAPVPEPAPQPEPEPVPEPEPEPEPIPVPAPEPEPETEPEDDLPELPINDILDAESET